ncbi:MAG: DUF4276 family protein [Planctomycetes bacterium]|nr:DUF4276 family protein [Planctomycetota bacterium]
MIKLAVFVEGQTEQLFVQRLVQEVAGHHNVEIELAKASHGGKSGLPRRFLLLQPPKPLGKQFFVLIVDSATDSRVASDIRDQYGSLVSAGYSLVLGLRDVYPELRSEIPRIRRAIDGVLPKGSVSVNVVLAIMEVEAWFLAEHTHFARLYPGLTLEMANNAIGDDLQTLDVEDIAHPTETLNTIYQLVGRAYRKKKDQVSDIVKVLDYDHLYVELRNGITAFSSLCDHLDSFLSSETAPKSPT